MFHQWLIAYDFEPCCDAAAHAAARLAVAQARTDGVVGRLVLCHVVLPPPLPMSTDVFGAPDALGLIAQSSLDAGLRLDAAADTLRQEYPSLQVDAVVQSGPPVESLLAEADRQNVDAIAVGSHGRTGLAHALLGSTAEKCANKARKPVLVVKVEEPPQFASV